MITRVIIFLILNFAALGIGGLFTGDGVSSLWYAELNKAPWTPPGWVFGAAWTLIMVCLAFYMAYAWDQISNRRLLLGLYILQLILNVAWNPVFFYYQAIAPALVIITSLTILVGFLLFFYWPQLKAKSLFIAPYLLWLVIATSLNAYILLNN